MIVIEENLGSLVVRREFATREAAARYAAYGDYAEEIEAYLKARGYDNADREAQSRVTEILVDFLKWQNERAARWAVEPDAEAKGE